MNKKPDEKGITAKKNEDMPEWYSQVCLKSELADYSPVKGTMVIRPYGYDLWQKIEDDFNSRIKKQGVKNAYFPLFIPESFFKKESEHAKGFSPEVAWISNKDEDAKEKLAIRPTSETIMYDSYSRWVRSWRDLPLRINQWCNIVRWEVSDVKLFIRSREFLWQEGHCVYETEQECEKEALIYLKEYEKLCKDLLALPLLVGKKTQREKFAGAKHTYTIEAFMPDGKALQCGTSHNLGQGFAKAFGISYIGKDEKSHLPWQNSWGISTRLIGALVMTHSDDKGLVLPPSIAPTQIAIVPIYKSEKEEVIGEAKKIKDMLKGYSVYLDDRDERTPGWKFNQHELKGVPLRIEIGPRDIKEKQVVLVRRDNGKKETILISKLNEAVKQSLEDIQKSLYEKAKKFLEDSIVEVKDWKEFKGQIKNKKIVLAKHCGNPDCEEKIKAETTATARCIPLDQKKVSGNCVKCGKQADYEVYFAKSY